MLIPKYAVIKQLQNEKKKVLVGPSSDVKIYVKEPLVDGCRLGVLLRCKCLLS